jgi:hypothetical protein
MFICKPQEFSIQESILTELSLNILAFNQTIFIDPNHPHPNSKSHNHTITNKKNMAEIVYKIEECWSLVKDDLKTDRAQQAIWLKYSKDIRNVKMIYDDIKNREFFLRSSPKKLSNKDGNQDFYDFENQTRGDGGLAGSDQQVELLRQNNTLIGCVKQINAAKESVSFDVVEIQRQRDVMMSVRGKIDGMNGDLGYSLWVMKKIRYVQNFQKMIWYSALVFALLLISSLL